MFAEQPDGGTAVPGKDPKGTTSSSTAPAAFKEPSRLAVLAGLPPEPPPGSPPSLSHDPTVAAPPLPPRGRRAAGRVAATPPPPRP